MAPREGNDIVKHGVLDPRLNVHGTKNLKCADLSICPDNVGMYSVVRADDRVQHVLDCVAYWRKSCYVDCRGSRIQWQGLGDESPRDLVNKFGQNTRLALCIYFYFLLFFTLSSK